MSPRWASAPALRLHATLLVGVAGCGVAAWIEWRRALSGHPVAWAYAFEWPLFAVMGTYVWWRLLHAEPAPADEPAGTTGIAADDPGLAAWQRYVERLHAADPPGGPPADDRV